MSHIVTIDTVLRDAEAIAAAARRLALPAPVHGEAKLFSGSRTGWQVQLPAWRYPIVCETEAGTVHFDHFNNRWGDRAR